MNNSEFIMSKTLMGFVLVCGLSAGCVLGDEHDADLWGLADEAACDSQSDYVVTQGDFTTTIQPIEGSLSAAAFYDYYNASAHTGLEAAEESTLFVYRDTMSNQFSLFLIHDDHPDSDGGASELRIQGLDNAAFVAVNDHPTEGIDVDDVPADGPTTEITATWNWAPCCTDGTAVTFESEEICVTIDPQRMEGIDTWAVLSGASATRMHLPELMAPFSICFDGNQPPVADPGEPQVLECTDGGATATLDGSGSFDPDGDPLSYQWLIDGAIERDGAVVSAFLPVGYHTADLTVSDGVCEDTAGTTVDVVDTIPPTITVAGSVDLWPPNHKYHTVSLADCGVAIDDACEGELDLATAQAAITCVSSDEPVNATGDGNTVADVVFVDDTTVTLRSERRGMHDGRVYKIHFTVQDAAGNTASGTCTAGVPHDQHGTPPVDSGEVWSVCSPAALQVPTLAAQTPTDATAHHRK